MRRRAARGERQNSAGLSQLAIACVDSFLSGGNQQVPAGTHGALGVGDVRALITLVLAGKPQLAHAALIAAVKKDPITVPDTGSLRGDVISLLRQANSQRGHLAVTVSTRLGGFYRDTGTRIADLRDALEGERGASMEKLIARAVARGEIRPGQIGGRVAQLPVDLLRHDVLFTLAPLTDEAIEEIVDTVFLPLVRLGAEGNT